MAEESQRETPVERDVSTVPAAKLKAVRACDAGSPVRGRPFAANNEAAKGRRRAVSPIAQLDRLAKQVVRGLMRGMTSGALEPQRANAVIFALKFRAELFSAFQAAAQIAALQQEVEEMRAFIAERLGQ